MSTLSFQPEADALLRGGPLARRRPVGATSPRAPRRAPGQGRARPRRPRGHLRGAAPRRASRSPRAWPPPACSPATSSSCSAATRSRPPSRCSAACTAASCSRRCRRCSTPRSSSALSRPDAGEGDRRLRRREGDRQVRAASQPTSSVCPRAPAGARSTSSLAEPTRRTSARARHADDVAMVMHSSGTTSAPKGIAHSSNTLRYATEGICRRWELTGDDMLPRRVRVRLRRRPRLRLLPGPAQRRHRRAR